MPTSVGVVYVDVRPNLDKFGDELKTGITDSTGAASEEAGKKLSGSLGTAARVAASAIAGTKLVDFLKDSAGAASDLNESVSKSGVVFGQQSKAIEDWAATSAKSMGISTQAAIEAAGTYGNLFRAMGIATGKSADMSKSLVQLSSDLASFNNANPEEVLLALRSGLAGETEPLKKFGVNLNAARIESEAFALGLAKPAKNAAEIAKSTDNVETATRKLAEATKEHGKNSEEARDAQIALDLANQKLAKSMAGQKVELDAAQKAQAAYSLIMKDTTLAQGDFARTSDGVANKQRIVAAQMENTKAAIGDKLLPVQSSLLNMQLGLLNVFGALPPAVQTAATALGGMAATVAPMIGMLPRLADGLSMLKPIAGSVANAIGDAAGFMADAMKTAMGAIRTAIMSTIEFMMANPWIAAIAGLILITVLIIKNWDTVKEALTTAWNFIKDTAVAVFGAIIGFFKQWWDEILAVFLGPIGMITYLILHNWETIKDATVGAFNAVVGFVADLPHRLWLAGKGMWDFFLESFKVAWNAIAKFISNLDFTIDVPDFIPGVPDKITIGFPDLPQLGDGGVVTGSGYAITGERGPEIVRLPRAATVTPLAATSNGGSVAIDLTFNGAAVSARDVVDELGWLMRTTGR